MWAAARLKKYQKGIRLLIPFIFIYKEKKSERK
nr:MAG TPA: hypothetical protein [Caudoviricetes sp.]